MIVNPQTVLLAQSGNKEAIEELVSASKDSVTTIVMGKLRHTHDCDEVVQDVFLRMIRKLHQLDNPSKFSGWICQMANRLAINKVLRRPKEKPTENAYLETPQESDPFISLNKKEISGVLHEAMKNLRDRDRKILQVFYFDGTPTKEIAETLNVPLGTAKRRMHTARERLRNEITKITKTELCSAN